MTYKYKGGSVEVVVRGELGGAGDLLLLHGWGCDHKIFDLCCEYLSLSYRVYVFDLPGFGASDEPATTWGTQEYADMIHSFVVDNNIENPILMGHSFGGRTSILYASQHAVSKLILIDSAGVVPARSAEYYFKVYSFKFMRKACQLLLPKSLSQKTIDKRRGKSASADYNNASPRMRAILSRVVNEDLKPVMPKITAPTLLFWGDADTATPISDARIMEKLIPNAEIVIASGCGHYSFLESRGLFDAVIKKFLK